MRKGLLMLTLLSIAGLIAIPVDGAEFRVTGFFDNIIPHVNGNISNGDRDLTRNGDQAFFARERTRFFFNFIASDDLRGVFALEQDNIFGAPSRNAIGSRCITGTGLFANEQCGFDLGIDNNNFEIKHLYVDFRVPQLPIGNRWRIGGIPADVTPLHPHLLFTMDSGGGNVRFDFTEQISFLAHYIQLEEDLDRFTGSTKIGEDYIAGGTLMLKPLPGLDLHLLGIFGHLQAPFGPSLRSTIGPFVAVQGASTNVVTEDRYYVGFDSRYRLGNLDIEPTFLFLFGDRKFCTPGSLTNTTGTAIPCSSVRGGPDEIDFEAFGAQLSLRYRLGPWDLQLKGAFASGNEASDDVNNQGIPGTKREDVKRFLPLGIDAFHRFGENFEILGRQVADGTSPSLLAGNPGELAGLDRFGFIHVGLRPQYKVSDRLTLEGAVGAFWTHEKTGCPASLRTGPGGACANRLFDFTGNSRYLGTEVDAGTIYTIMPGLIWQTRFGWAFLGDAFQIQHRNVQDAWLFVNRLLYTF